VLIIIGIAGAAALAVIAYNIYKDTRPDLVTLSTRRAQQLAAVVLVFSRAVEGVIEALSYGMRPEPALPDRGSSSQGRSLLETWDEEEY